MPIVGKHILDWEKNRGVRGYVKVIAIAMVTTVVVVSLLSQKVGVPMKVAIVVVAALGVTVILRLPTTKE